MGNEYMINALNFLITDYKCVYSTVKEGGCCDHVFNNGVFQIRVCTFEERGDLNIFLYYKLGRYDINPDSEEPEKMSELRKRKKGLKRLFYDRKEYESDFWAIVAEVTRRKIETVVK